ncbi:MAG: NAD(P)-binding domain-containing protein [Pseudomonadales bacterium]
MTGLSLRRIGPASPRRVDVVVVGGGQAGLATSVMLRELGIDHVVFERGEIGQRWRHERWRSLRLLTPNWMCRLPNQEYDGADRDDFMTKDEAADFLCRYAHRQQVEVASGTEVTEVVPERDGFLVVANEQVWRCRAVVDASGAFGRAKLPPLAAEFPAGLHQLAAADYRVPDQLPDGGVLVVGASATGLQIAEELLTSGRRVTLAVGEHVRMPRSYRGRDVYWWLNRSGVLHETIEDVDDIERARRVPSPQLIGRHGCNMDLNRLQDLGAEIVGRVVAVRGRTIQFSGGLANHLKSADLKMHRMLDRFDQTPADGLDLAPPDRPQASRSPTAPRLELSLDSGEFSSVFWATGYRPDHRWLRLPAFDRKGRLTHDAGVVRAVPGLYTLGHTFLRSRKSSFLYGVDEDVRHIAAHLRRYLDGAFRERVAAMD